MLEFDKDGQHTQRFCSNEQAAPVLQGLAGQKVEGRNALSFLLQQADLFYPYWKLPAEQTTPAVGSDEQTSCNWETASALITPVMKSQTQVVLVVAVWGADEIDKQHLHETLDQLRPYARAISKSLTMSHRLFNAECQQRILQSMLWNQKEATLLVDHTLKILFQTPAAQAALDEDGFFAAHEGYLSAQHPDLDQALSTLKRYLAGARRPLSRQLLTAVVSEPEKSIFLSNRDGAHCHIRLQCILPEEDLPHETGIRFPPAHILIHIREAASVKLQVREFLQNTYALSQSEARLAHDLAISGSLATTLTNLGITRNTAKTHLRRIYEKTETQSQLELALLIHRLANLF